MILLSPLARLVADSAYQQSSAVRLVLLLPVLRLNTMECFEVHMALQERRLLHPSAIILRTAEFSESRQYRVPVFLAALPYQRAV